MSKIKPRCIFVWIAAFLVLPAPLVSATPAEQNAAVAVHGGDITGQLQRCGASLSMAKVYIPGESFIAITDTGGNFVLRYVQPGSYTLLVEKDGSVLDTISDVAVIKNKVTQLGVFNACPDADNDQFDESVDCDDQNPAINPSATEVCDGVDNNCNGSTDEGCPVCTDGDSDGFYAQSGCGTAVDCNDNSSAVSPRSNEICFDSIDNNCNGQVDEDCLSCIPGATCDTGSAGVCGPGVFDAACVCRASTQPSAEICDGIDNDCNGTVDDSCSCTAGLTNCNGQCVNTNSDAQNCGGCNTACSAGFSCIAGSCVDINECASAPCGAGTCSQLFGGGYTCSCPPPQFFNGTTCVNP